MTLSSELTQSADRYIDEHHETFSKLGERFFEVFSYDDRNNRISTQIRNLQQIACSATRFADIEDFVKNQMGKERTDERTPPKWKAVGGKMLKQLKALRDDSQLFDGDPANQLAIRLRLARGWARAVVSEYLYRVALDQMEAPE